MGRGGVVVGWWWWCGHECSRDVFVDTTARACTLLGWQNAWESDSRRPRYPALTSSWTECEKCLENDAKYPFSELLHLVDELF